MNTTPGKHVARTEPDVSVRALDRLARAHDASHFARTPQAVATVRDASEVARLFTTAATAGLPITFRSGGTSLSGQAVTDGLLVDTRRHFRHIEILDAGARVKVGPGATVRQVNTRLARYGRVLGPDPASEVACTLGGVVANNSSGMSCGTAANSYALLESLELVLPSGTVLDTGDRDADERLRHLEPALWRGLARLRDRVRDNPESRARIERLFALKNTMGYGLNAFLDHDRPVDLLTRLIVGSEGTLAFIASITMRTVPVASEARTGLLVFADLAAANRALPALVDTGPAAIELLDSTSLRVGQGEAVAIPSLRDLDVREHAALLVEYREETATAVEELTRSASAVLQEVPLEGPRKITADHTTRAALWQLRKGLYAKVADARPAGTAALLEDIAVPLPELLPTCQELTALFAKHGYDHSVIFGHAKDGNIHFMLTERLGEGSGRDRFGRFTDDMVDLVLGRGGTLKAEHGTGRMMTPFVRRQYGDELYAVMQEIKQLCDPRGLLNPGVILDDDPQAHLADLKTSPVVEEEVDRCVECGFCEPACPSRDLTITPRQRIVLRREIERARQSGDTALLAELEIDYAYAGVDTCAVDGMCQTACPVRINTGDLVRRLRAERPQRVAAAGWTAAAKHWGAAARVAGVALDVAHLLPARAVEGAAVLTRRVLNPDVVPKWSADLPGSGGGRVPRSLPKGQPDAVLFSSCTGTMFGPTQPDGTGAAEAFARLCARAGVRLAVPDRLPSLCCGTPWKSKGYGDGFAAMAERVLPALLDATDGGRLPVVCDAASCTEGLHHMLESAHSRYQAIRVLDAVEFTADHLLDKLTVTRFDSLALRPTCSAQRMGLTPTLHRVAEAIAERVTVPDDWGCCGFAGDRGLLHPELTAAATAPQAAQLAGGDFSAFASCNRTCELGMARATGQPYVHILELLERAAKTDQLGDT
ncbi:FAD-binding and (Fe-S)-binding domain-containing protein [Streptomyces sp. NPDC000151]|uniref:FAD-binding and (Fe-S)-binding domain-containing protein n=1 Tax=Streptomyces sp. NPDC000151 TaxID=3154244 RepID=UPI003317201F